MPERAIGIEWVGAADPPAVHRQHRMVKQSTAGNASQLHLRG